MIDYTDYHARVAHAQHCPHDEVWMLEPLVAQLSNPETAVMFEDHQYLAGLINHLAEQIDTKDAQLAEGVRLVHEADEMLKTAHASLLDTSRKLVIASAGVILLVGLVMGILLK